MPKVAKSIDTQNWAADVLLSLCSKVGLLHVKAHHHPPILRIYPLEKREGQVPPRGAK